MTYPYTRYLAAKKTVDDRALNRGVLADLRGLLPPGACRVVEIGAGLGTMVARLLEWQVLSSGEYVLLDVDRQLLVLNNRSYCEILAGRFPEALLWSAELQELSARHGIPLRVGRLDTVGRALMELGRLEEAEAAMLPGLHPEVLDALGTARLAQQLALLRHRVVTRVRLVAQLVVAWLRLRGRGRAIARVALPKYTEELDALRAAPL